VDQSSDTHDQSTSDVPGQGGSGGSVAWILAFCAAAVVALLVLQYMAPAHDRGNDQAGDQSGVGHRLPDLQLEPLTGDGHPVRLNDLAGKVVLLDFWGTWCPPCRAEFPHIAALGDEYRDRPDFQLLAVSCGGESGEDPQSLRTATQEFLDDRKLDMATYSDPGGFTRREVDKVAGFEGYPSTLVLDRQGVIRGMWVGYEPGTERKIGELIQKLLAATPPK
jgi:thiol-disulfide isomerase/thioredoxin